MNYQQQQLKFISHLYYIDTISVLLFYEFVQK